MREKLKEIAVSVLVLGVTTVILVAIFCSKNKEMLNYLTAYFDKL